MSLNKANTTAELYDEGVRSLMAGRFAEAAAFLEGSLSRGGANPDALAALCLAAHEEGRHGLLHSSIMRLLELDEAEAAIRRATAVDLYDGGFYMEAVVSALESLVISPEDPLGCYVLGRSYLALHMLSEAERSLRRALRSAPDFAVARSLLCWIDDYKSAPETRRPRLLEHAPRVRMHEPPPDEGELSKYPFSPDSIKELFGGEEFLLNTDRGD